MVVTGQWRAGRAVPLGDAAQRSSVGHRRALGLSADGAGRSDGQRGEDDGAEPLTRGPGKQGAAGRGRGGGRAEQPDWAGWVSAQAETSSSFFLLSNQDSNSNLNYLKNFEELTKTSLVL